MLSGTGIIYLTFLPSVLCIANGIVCLQISLEAPLMPFLFLSGAGMRTNDMSPLEYSKMRVRQFFSVFTLYKPFILLQFAALQMHRIVSGMREASIDKEADRFKRANPTANDVQVTRHLLQSTIPPNVLHSPRWWNARLADIKAIVNKRGLPTLFLTLTADEFSATRFSEMDALDNFLRRIGLNDPQVSSCHQTCNFMCSFRAAGIENSVLCRCPGKTALQNVHSCSTRDCKLS